MPEPQPHVNEDVLYSPWVSASANATFGFGGQTTWDSFVRKSYQTVLRALDEQGVELVRRGNITFDELRHMVDGQRNALVVEMRKKLSPFGRLYSEILKPSARLPRAADLLGRKGTAEAVLLSVGKGRGSVNRFAATLRVGGPMTVVLQVGLSGMIIAAASEEERARVVAGQTGVIGGAALGGAGGAWAGCAALASLASPSMVVPLYGQLSTGGACALGGALGAFGGGFLGGWLGETAAAAAYDYATRLEWIEA